MFLLLVTTMFLFLFMVPFLLFIVVGFTRSVVFFFVFFSVILSHHGNWGAIHEQARDRWLRRWSWASLIVAVLIADRAHPSETFRALFVAEIARLLRHGSTAGVDANPT